MKLLYFSLLAIFCSISLTNCMEANRIQSIEDTYHDSEGSATYSSARHRIRQEKSDELKSTNILSLACGCLVVTWTIGWACTRSICSSKEKTD